MIVKASNLRQNIYQMLDEVAETGTPIEILRKGVVLKIVAERPPVKMSRMKKRDALNCDPEEIVHLDWSSEWKE